MTITATRETLKFQSKLPQPQGHSLDLLSWGSGYQTIERQDQPTGSASIMDQHKNKELQSLWSWGSLVLLLASPPGLL